MVSADTPLLTTDLTGLNRIHSGTGTAAATANESKFQLIRHIFLLVSFHLIGDVNPLPR